MKPSNPKGTRDFSPSEMARRNHIFDTIRYVYEKYGYVPIETPAMENLDTLLGKYGPEGDRLIFRILHSGEKLRTGYDELVESFKNVFLDNAEIQNKEIDLDEASKRDTFLYGQLGLNLTEKGLRYDLTVPFARYVVQHQNDITFPFKRYQIQPVWRGDRPQKGRYREFYQCDADVIGSNSLLNEVELVQIIDEVFSTLGIRVVIKINNRKILAGLAEIIGEEDKLQDITIAIDKIDKIGIDEVKNELMQRGVSQSAINQLQPLFDLQGPYQSKVGTLKTFLSDSEIGKKGIEEVEFLMESVWANRNIEVGHEFNIIELDVNLARGLSYYTGAIIEVVTEGFNGSLCGGGRYDDLTGIFGLKGVSGVGISFGADRIYDVMEQEGAFPEGITATTQLMLTNFGEEEAAYGLGLVTRLRKDGIHAELYPDAVKMKKQMSYANAKSIRYVGLAGSDEIAEGKITLKDMQTGDQQSVSEVELYEILKSEG